MPYLPLAQATDIGLPSASEAMVWGPLGLGFVVGLYFLIDWWFFVQRPRLKRKSVNEQAQYDAHIQFIGDTSSNLGKLAKASTVSARASKTAASASQRVVTVIEKFGDRVERVEQTTDWIKSHLERGKPRCDPDPSGPASTLPPTSP